MNDKSKAALEAVSALKEHDLWGQYRTYPRRDWKREVANDDTHLGYWDWVEHQIESAETDENVVFCTCKPSCGKACKGQCGCLACQQAWADDQSLD